MEGRDLLAEGLRRVDMLEAWYERLAVFAEPSDLEENPLPSVRTCLAALRSLERCVEMRIKLVREAGRMPSPEPPEPLATVDLSRLSDEALREVEEAMVPLDPESEEERDGDDRRELCKKINENKIVSAAAVPKRKETALPEPVPALRKSPCEVAAKAKSGKPSRAAPTLRKSSPAAKAKSGKPPEAPSSG